MELNVILTKSENFCAHRMILNLCQSHQHEECRVIWEDIRVK